MDTDRVIAILSDLLDREQRALVPRLFESSVFVSKLSLAAYEWARRVARSSIEHCAVLTDLILELGGEPPPRSVNLEAAELHYQELSAVLPRVKRDINNLIRAYRTASEQLGSEPRASAVVNSILAEHEAELSALEALNAGAKAAIPA